MKSPMRLLWYVLQDMGTLCRASTTRDFKTITRRVEDEGLSFLTITLPSFCADFERSLDQGYVGSDHFLGFKRSGGLPRFLSGFLSQVFDTHTCRLLDEPDVSSIFAIRQITLLFKKVLLPCTEKRTRKAYEKFIQCESDVHDWSQSVSPELIAHYDIVSDILWSNTLYSIDRKVYETELTPRHGPGATADKLYGNAKYNFQYWTRRLEEYFPSSEFLIPNWGYRGALDSVTYAEPEAEIPVKVITVPKTLKTPRIIAVEPTCMQYAQQALMAVLVKAIEEDDFLSGRIGFSDQVPNQVLACQGSLDGSLSTIDLSEASDRVPNLLVKRLFRHFPSLSGALDASRSRRADVPGHGVIPLSKFASMGSAVCFPVEAMVFFTVVASGIYRQLAESGRQGRLKTILADVRVYGDDIIVPTDYTHSVLSELRAFGFVVNDRKSFWTGKFRESCGRDYYAGCDVSVTYVRRMFPATQHNASEMISLVSLRNQLYKAGLWESARYLDTCIEKVAPFPVVLETSPVIGRHSFLGYSSDRLCSKLHSPIVKGMVIRAKPRRSPSTGVGALLKFFLKQGEDPIFDAKHLERYGRPEHVDIKVRWASAT